MTRKKTGAIQSTKSKTRSATLKGRASHRRNSRQLPRAAQVVGLPMRPKPDPKLLPWPNDFGVFVAKESIDVRTLRGRIVDEICSDCGKSVRVDSRSIELAVAIPELMRRPLKIICEACKQRYSMDGVKVHRTG
jgi:hypothetical protein